MRLPLVHDVIHYRIWYDTLNHYNFLSYWFEGVNAIDGAPGWKTRGSRITVGKMKRYLSQIELWESIDIG